MKPFALSTLAAAFAALIGTAPLAGAATLSEQDLAAEFSGDFRNPTRIEAGVTAISGIWSGGNDYDILVFDKLATGAQELRLSFAPLTPIGPTDWSFSAGGTLTYSLTPFTGSAWEAPAVTLGIVGIQHYNRDESFDWVIRLGDDFAGTLYLGLLNTYGTLGYRIDAPGNAVATEPALPPVPLPAGGVLSLTGLAGLAALGWRRRSKAA